MHQMTVSTGLTVPTSHAGRAAVSRVNVRPCQARATGSTAAAVR